MKCRKANIDDIETLITLRKKQLIDEGTDPTIDIDKELYNFFQNKLSDGSLIQWLVEDKEEIIASGAVVFYEFPPSYTNRTGKKAYVTNMFTKENYRGQGIASTLLTKLVDEVKEAGITKMWLGAPIMGRPVYKKFGFQETDEWMEMKI